MKHNIKVTLILLGMFLLTQFIGLYVVNTYSISQKIDGQVINVTDAPSLPYGMETPPVEKESDYISFFYSIIIAFIIAITLLFILTKFKAEFILKLWFFIVVTLALGITINSFFPVFKWASFIALAIALPIAFIKIYKTGFLIHNLSELLIYPGIASVFVPILNLPTMIILLVLISVYDIWAVWHSGIMQKMAKYQIQKLNVFSGFFIPYASKKIKDKIKFLKEKYQSKKMSQKDMEKHKIKVNVALLGGGDIIFPIITSGVMLKSYGFNTIYGISIPLASIFVILGATVGLAYLLIYSEKKKFYPAMPFISTGIFLGMILSWLVL